MYFQIKEGNRSFDEKRRESMRERERERKKKEDKKKGRKRKEKKEKKRKIRKRKNKKINERGKAHARTPPGVNHVNNNNNVHKCFLNFGCVCVCVFLVCFLCVSCVFLVCSCVLEKYSRLN